MTKAYVDRELRPFMRSMLNIIQGYHKVSPLFVPRLLINLAAGHITMRFGFKVRFIDALACGTF